MSGAERMILTSSLLQQESQTLREIVRGLGG